MATQGAIDTQRKPRLLDFWPIVPLALIVIAAYAWFQYRMPVDELRRSWALGADLGLTSDEMISVAERSSARAGISMATAAKIELTILRRMKGKRAHVTADNLASAVTLVPEMAQARHIEVDRATDFMADVMADPAGSADSISAVGLPGVA